MGCCGTDKKEDCCKEKKTGEKEDCCEEDNKENKENKGSKHWVVLAISTIIISLLMLSLIF